MPTETVVGLVSAESGLERIREIKGRDAHKPIALLCRSPEEAFGFAANAPRLALALAELFWPGPLTLVLDLSGGGTVGVRVPANDREGRSTQVITYFLWDWFDGGLLDGW